MLPQPKNPHFGDLVLTPRETRDLFKQIGYKRVVGFRRGTPCTGLTNTRWWSDLNVSRKKAISPGPC